jgi:dolichol-phosphate mannosyltransferase
MADLISVVLPVFDERENLEALWNRLRPALEHAANGSFEVVFVDDGSSDGSAVLLDALHQRDGRCRVIHLSRNFGHQAALQAGLDAARGRAVIMMAADLQDPPEVVDRLLAKWREGYEVVYAIRRRRKEGLLKRSAYAFFYRTIKTLAEIDVPLDAGDFCLLDRRVVDALISLPEHNRFLRGLRSWVGFRQIGVEYERDVRNAGTPKYTLRKLVRLALSGYVGFSAMPLRLASWLGFFAAAAGFGFAVWAIVAKILNIPTPRGWASTLAVIMFIGGVQLVVLGIMGEYLSRVYDEVRRRPLYVVRTRLGFDEVRPAREERDDEIDRIAGS